MAVYLLHLPEKLLPPGTVDLWGSSHQLWHLLILSGDSIFTITFVITTNRRARQE